MRTMRLETIEFKRGEKAPWETGVLVNEGMGPIIDMNGIVVPAPLWNWRPISEQVMTVLERPAGSEFRSR